jgi:hypothetical protein
MNLRQAPPHGRDRRGAPSRAREWSDSIAPPPRATQWAAGIRFPGIRRSGVGGRNPDTTRKVANRILLLLLLLSELVLILSHLRLCIARFRNFASALADFCGFVYFEIMQRTRWSIEIWSSVWSIGSWNNEPSFNLWIVIFVHRGSSAPRSVHSCVYNFVSTRGTNLPDSRSRNGTSALSHACCIDQAQGSWQLDVEMI